MNDQRKQRAARAEQMRKERERHERRQRNLITVVFAVAIVALIAGVGVWYVQNKPEGPESYADAPSKMVEPENVNDDYGIEYKAEDEGGKTDDDAPRVVLYEDFQCPACQMFEEASGDYLKDRVQKGEIIVEYRALAMLDEASETEYSSRAGNAAVCVNEETDVNGFEKMHDILYANQPEEGSEGLPDSKLVSYAQDAGADKAEKCIKKRTYDPWLRKGNDAAADDGVEGTPTVQVNGEDVEGKDGGAIPTPEELEKAIANA